jgi:cation diffusion facilitator CzcD-associated flavoprotein CzcO
VFANMGSIGLKYPTPAVSLSEHPATLPEVEIPEDIDIGAIVTAILPQLLVLTADVLAENAIWRDHMALTGTFRTFHTPELVAKTWRFLCKRSGIANLAVMPGTAQVLRFGPSAWVQASFSFDTSGTFAAACSGTIGLVPHDGTWKIWLITTILEQPCGFPDVDKLEPGRPPSLNTGDLLDCVIVGGASAGLSLAGRLKSLGLSYVVMEQYAEVGDIWTKARYDSVKLHTSRDYNQLPGSPRSFQPEDPYYLSSHDIAAGFKKYVKTFGINVMTSTTVTSAKFDRSDRVWTIIAQSSGEKLTVRARHLVLATGSMGAMPSMPEYKSPEKYQGDTIHTVHWKNAKPWKGKRGIVIGSANSAHDVIADMVAADFESVTLVQRSKTWVLPASTFGTLVDPIYNPQTPSEVSDRILMSNPLPIQRLIAIEGIRACADTKPAYFDALEAQGFKTERYGDLWGTIYDREGGHFFDVGAGELIADGKVKVKSDALPTAYTETGLEFSDGSQLDADVVVFATGYKSDLRESARRIVGDEAAENLEEFWQCDREGETRGAWRDTGREQFYYTVQVRNLLIVLRSRPVVHRPWLCPRSILFAFLGHQDQGRC